MIVLEMSFQGLTPEALAARSDSKNPATTCKGLTASGRPCRRGLAGTPGTSPASSPIESGDGDGDGDGDGIGVVAILDEESAAAFFCWQHKDQAESLVQKLNGDRRRTTVVPLRERSSIDTLAERVGVLDLDGEGESGVALPDMRSQGLTRHEVQRLSGRAGSRGVNTDRHGRKQVKRRDRLPQEWQHIQGPLMSVPEEVMQDVLLQKVETRPRPRPRPSQVPQQRRHGRSNVRASWGCCIRADDDYNDDGLPPRRRERREYQSEQRRPKPHSSRPSSHQANGTMNAKMNARQAVPQVPQMQERVSQNWQPHSQISEPPPTQPLVSSPSSSSPHTKTQSLLSLIPSNLDPTTTSQLLSELSKPLPTDDEPGFIYIFWLTPTSDPSKPDDDIASTLLDNDSLSYQNDDGLYPSLQNPTSLRSRHQSRADSSPRRRKVELTAQALARFASTKRSDKRDSPDKILLKIGRAQNVHRRMTQWTKQCNQNITLVRYYPQPASTPADPASPGGVKVPHVVRVERLIHLELRGLGMGKKELEKCAECGREHREWFEVPATRDGLRVVDGVVRRWVGWGENAT